MFHCVKFIEDRSFLALSLWKEVKKQASSDRQRSFQELAHPCLSKIICFYFSTFFSFCFPLLYFCNPPHKLEAEKQSRQYRTQQEKNLNQVYTQSLYVQNRWDGVEGCTGL
jgi:hypothetical protein